MQFCFDLERVCKVNDMGLLRQCQFVSRMCHNKIYHKWLRIYESHKKSYSLFFEHLAKISALRTD